VNPERADQIRDRIRRCPKEIRLLCPHGHFIANIALDVPDDEDAPILMHARGPDKPSAIDRHAGSYGFEMSMHPSNPGRSVKLKCTNSHCTYTGWFGYLPLALELAAAALAGQLEHRLTT
jgi:hypothetical protein